jgi:hypothetical protein
MLIQDDFEEVQRPQELYDGLSYLPQQVADDFSEALTCYSQGCFNAFGAMCRRCIQSAAMALGVTGNDKVMAQINNLKALADLDESTIEELKQIVITGHDGAHPHLPSITQERASLLLIVMKDVLDQLFVRRGKIEEMMKVRRQRIEASL